MQDRIRTKAMRILSKSPNQIQKSMDRTGGTLADAQEVCDYLSAMSQRAALYAEYIGERTGAGNCGCRKDHDDAAEHAQSVVSKVRKALGYTYADRGLAGFNW